MPVEYSKDIENISHQRFYDLDEIVIKCAFDIHNNFGKFFDEKIYTNMLKKMLDNLGITAEREVCIKVSHKDFVKKYFIDLLVDKGIIYEIKTVDSLSNIHEQQLINYLLLSNLNYGQLINFRTTSVEKRFVSTKLNYEERKNHFFDFQNWNPGINNSSLLKDIIIELLNDWGTFLDYNLYREAIVYFLGGKEKIEQLINIIDNGKKIGQQKFCLLNNKTAFHLSGISSNLDHYEEHIYRLLKYVDLETIQWINFNKNDIRFKTINT